MVTTATQIFIEEERKGNVTEATETNSASNSSKIVTARREAVTAGVAQADEIEVEEGILIQVGSTARRTQRGERLIEILGTRAGG